MMTYQGPIWEGVQIGVVVSRELIGTDSFTNLCNNRKLHCRYHLRVFLVQLYGLGLHET
jgi:hypothetical protein